MESARNVALVTYDYGPSGRFSSQFRKVIEFEKLRNFKVNLNGQIRAKVEGCCVLVAISGGGGGRVLLPNIPWLLYSQPVFGFNGKLEFYYKGCPKSKGEFIEFEDEEVGGQFKGAVSIAARYQIKKKISKLSLSAFEEAGGYGNWYYKFADGESNTSAGFYARAVAEISFGNNVWHRFQKNWNSSDVDF